MRPARRGLAGDGDARERVLRAVRRHFRPEFVNRLDDIVVFRPLDRAALLPIVGLHLAALSRLMAEQRIRLEVSDGSVDWLAERGHHPEYGARPLRRLVQDVIQDPIADLVLRGELAEGSRVRVDLDGDALRVRPAR